MRVLPIQHRKQTKDCYVPIRLLPLILSALQILSIWKFFSVRRSDMFQENLFRSTKFFKVLSCFTQTNFVRSTAIIGIVHLHPIALPKANRAYIKCVIRCIVKSEKTTTRALILSQPICFHFHTWRFVARRIYYTRLQ